MDGMPKSMQTVCKQCGNDKWR